MAITNFGDFQKHMLDRWKKADAEAEERAQAFFESMRQANRQALDTQAQRYEAAINPAYKPDPEPEPQIIKFKRPIPFGRAR